MVRSRPRWLWWRRPRFSASTSIHLSSTLRWVADWRPRADWKTLAPVADITMKQNWQCRSANSIFPSERETAWPLQTLPLSGSSFRWMRAACSSSEASELEQAALIHLNELPDSGNVCRGQAVSRSDGKIEFADRHCQFCFIVMSATGASVFQSALGRQSATHLKVLDKWIEVLAENLGRLHHSHLGRERTIGPDF